MSPNFCSTYNYNFSTINFFYNDGREDKVLVALKHHGATI